MVPNIECGLSTAPTFTTLLKAAQPDVELVAEQAPPMGHADSARAVQAFSDAKTRRALYNAAQILLDVALQMQCGGMVALVALVGRNGAGKSIKLKALMGLVQCPRPVAVPGQAIFSRKAQHAAHRGLRLVPDNATCSPT